jgi:hypothetical protein
LQKLKTNTMDFHKKIKSLLLVLMAAIMPLAASAYDFMVDGLCYKINNIERTTVSVTRENDSGYSNLSGDLVIPESVTYDDKTYPVTAIDSYAFWGCSGLTSVTIPNSVTEIGKAAFARCSGLTAIIVDDENTMYDSRDNCNAIIETTTNKLVAACKNTTIPNSVTSIGKQAFEGLSEITSIVIPCMVTSIESSAFYGCTGLTDILFPNSLVSIGDYAFYGCTGLTSVNLGISIQKIGASAFRDCNNLTSLTMGNSVYIIGSQAIPYSLTSLTITGLGYSSIDIDNSSWLYIMNHLKTVNIGSEILSLGNLGFAPQVINCYAETPPECSQGTFANYNGVLNVPSTSTAAYFTAEYWQNFTNLHNNLTSKVTFDKTEANLTQWETLELTASVFPEDEELVWSSTKPWVATVSDDGVVTATGNGGCYIFATLASNPAVYASCRILSSYPEITLSLNTQSLEMSWGEEATLIATVTPDNTGLIPTWESSNTSVATVNNGVVTAVGDGECDITVRVLNKTATCHVIVNSNVVIKLNMANAIIGVNQLLTLFPSCTPNVPIELIVTSSDPNIAIPRIVYTFDGEKVIRIVGKSIGNATITVSTADGNAIPATLELRVVDVNEDGTITSSDVTALYDLLLNGDTTHITTSDVNGDGNITAADITSLYNILLGL